MSFKKKALLGVILASSATMSLQAFASPYIGASLGQSDYDAVEDGTSYELKAGYKFSNNIAIQGSYIDFGDIDDNTPPVWTLSADAFELSVVGSYALGEKASLTGIFGVSMWDASVHEEGFGTLGGTDGTDILYGVGLDYVMNEAMSLVFQFKDYDIAIDGIDVDLSNISLGIKYQF